KVESRQDESITLPHVVSLGHLLSAPRGLKGMSDRAAEYNFSSQKELHRAIPGSGISMSWLTVEPEGSMPPKAHSADRLLIVLDGEARLTGTTPRTIECGDTVALPAGCAVGIDGISHHALSALLVVFQKENEKPDSPSPQEVVSLERLLEENEREAERVLANPYFRMIAQGGLQDEPLRNLFRDRLRVFCDAFQRFLFTRQATCTDDVYEGTFLEHMLEELGHNSLMQTSGECRRFDAVLSATSNWFCHQMIVQDNVGKAAIHLVLETGGDYFHNLA